MNTLSVCHGLHEYWSLGLNHCVTMPNLEAWWRNPSAVSYPNGDPGACSSEVLSEGTGRK